MRAHKNSPALHEELERTSNFWNEISFMAHPYIGIHFPHVSSLLSLTTITLIQISIHTCFNRVGAQLGAACLQRSSDISWKRKLPLVGGWGVFPIGSEDLTYCLTVQICESGTWFQEHRYEFLYSTHQVAKFWIRWGSWTRRFLTSIERS